MQTNREGRHFPLIDPRAEADHRDRALAFDIDLAELLAVEG
jgi:hypothetical protein